MTEKVYAQERRYPRAGLPSAMPVAWLGSDLQFFSHVRTGHSFPFATIRPRNSFEMGEALTTPNLL